MATGSGIPQPQAIATSDITPTYSVPHDHAIADALGNLGDAAQGVVNDLITKHYQTKGAQEGAAVAAGTQAYKDVPVITDVGKARQAAFQGAYLAGIKTDIDSHLEQTQRDNALDPAGFKIAADPIIAGYVSKAPGPFAVQVKQYAQTKAADAFSKLSDQKLQHDQVTSVNGVNARQAGLNDDIVAMAADGKDNTPEYLAKVQEWTQLNSQKVGNPLFNFSPEQAAEAETKQSEQLQGAVMTHHAATEYAAAGSGDAGKAAAFKFLDDQIAPGGALANLPPGQKLKAFSAARANIIDLDKADAENRAIKAEQARQDTAAKRDKAGELSLGLVDGSVSEADIHGAENRGEIEPGAAARLILGSRAQARREAHEAARDSASARSEKAGALREAAMDGMLTPAAAAGEMTGLTPAQRMAIKGAMNRNAKPIIENITGLAGAAFKDAGLQGAASKIALENLHADAAAFALNNPNSTVGQQTAFASDWVKKNKGIATPAAMGPVNTSTQNHAQYVAAYKARFHGQGVNDSDIENGWKRYQSTHPNAH